MSKTTPEEAIALALKYGIHQIAACHVTEDGFNERLASLIDEVRGVDAEPYGYVWFNEHMEHRFTRNKPHASQFCTDLKPIWDVPPHPAPSQPAAPVELSVISWDVVTGKPLVFLSDAQAAIAGRKAS